METAIFAVILGGAGVWVYFDIRWRLGLLSDASSRQRSTFEADLYEIRFRVDEIKTVLTEASKRNAARDKAPDSAFDRKDSDKIPTTPRYVPVARRRAQAEMASQGPQTHAEEVRKNNARALETL